MHMKEYLKDHILITDGAMGTYFDKKKGTLNISAEDANLSNPEIIQDIHETYMNAGANLLRTNTFIVNRSFALSRKIAGIEEQNRLITDTIRAAYRIASETARDKEDVWVAADIGPIPEYIFTQYEYDEKEEYRLLIDTFLDCGACIFNFETFADPHIPEWAASYIKSKNQNAFIMTSYSFGREGYTTKGLSMKRIFEGAAKHPHIDCYGSNCSIGASHMLELLQHQTFVNDKYVMILPNSGYPQIVRGHIIYSDQSDYFASKAAEILKLGVNVIGGCCGTTPAHIQALRNHLASLKPEHKLILAQDDAMAERTVTSFSKNNTFMRKLENGERVIAVELDPPFDQKAEKLLEGAYQLQNSNVDIITLADSPLGRSRADSCLLAARIKSMVDIDVMPHISCRDRNSISMCSTILGAHINNIRNVLVVTGDPVPSAVRDQTTSVFDYNSISFMEYLGDMNQGLLYDDPIAYGGALNQNQGIPERMVPRMQRKIDAGLSYFLTQPIYSDADIERIKYFKKALNTKILCGIMPLVSYRNALFIKNEMPGIYVPDEILASYRPDMTRREAEETAIQISLTIIRKLNGIADGFYFMTPFNRVSLITEIISNMED